MNNQAIEKAEDAELYNLGYQYGWQMARRHDKRNMQFEKEHFRPGTPESEGYISYMNNHPSRRVA